MPSTNATNQLLQHLKQQLELGGPSLPWSVGYSGGRDSAVLLWGMAQLVDPATLWALHVDHGWRSAHERAQEADKVAAWCDHLGVRLVSFGPPSEVLVSEVQARMHRYRCFRSFLENVPSASVFLAHHADDQAETVLMRLLKGRSWQGLAGMAARRGPFYRPLLDLSAGLLERVAVEKAIPWHEDSTNSNPKWLRNHLRTKVMPAIVDRYPSAVRALSQFAKEWQNNGPSSARDPSWTLSSDGGQVPYPIWESWGLWKRQAQLLAVCSMLDHGDIISRRFLETVCQDGRQNPARGAGWRWKVSGGLVHWNRVVQRAPKEYFVIAREGRAYQLEGYVLSWTADDPGGENLFLPSVSRGSPLIWRSFVPGMELPRAGLKVWTKVDRRRRLGSLAPKHCALVFQDGELLAAIDPSVGSIRWAKPSDGSLNRDGIFVKLEQRSDYERR